jgi:BirA family biotin operon repressor/biotin-[acetyl-CoA-carboxylase] ligase
MDNISRINLSTVDSTNSFVRSMLQEEGTGHVMSANSLPGFTLVVADDQTKGRGQQGNAWETEKGKNLTFSLLCHPDFILASRQWLLSQCMAVAIQQTLSQFVEDVEVKWPNDIYIGDKKISGTLIECDLLGKHISNCIIGVGININQTMFYSDAPNPTSLQLVTGKEYDREEILSVLLQHFQHFYTLLKEGQEDTIRQLYRQHLYRREGFHRYRDVRGEFMAEIDDIEPTGHLRLRFEDGKVVRYELKEVQFIKD